jgi:hypothetical protein
MSETTYGVGVGGGSEPFPGADQHVGTVIAAFHAYAVPTDGSGTRTTLCSTSSNPVTCAAYFDNWEFQKNTGNGDGRWPNNMRSLVCTTCNSDSRIGN